MNLTCYSESFYYWKGGRKKGQKEKKIKGEGKEKEGREKGRKDKKKMPSIEFEIVDSYLSPYFSTCFRMDIYIYMTNVKDIYEIDLKVHY